MKALKDCEFTAFISYAHADDAAWFDWVTHFRNELERSLGALLRGVRLPRFHLSGENGPVAGRLTDELKKRIDSSFAMIIVVHENYAQSDWCLKELEYFHSLFGDDGFRQR
ncbi:MAG TPA: toll/interleukin-1 receptor domain-containing protein, partial [Rubrivivax sp.]|nr:toll/interleukin-1 receptor domain-containing protein [Rubrivivax sp.]